MKIYIYLIAKKLKKNSIGIAKKNRNLRNSIPYYTGENFFPSLNQKPVVIKNLILQTKNNERYPFAEIDLVATGLLYPDTNSTSCLFENISPSEEIETVEIAKVFHTRLGEVAADYIGPKTVKMIGNVLGYEYEEEEIRRSQELQSQVLQSQGPQPQTFVGKGLAQVFGAKTVTGWGSLIGYEYSQNQS